MLHRLKDLDVIKGQIKSIISECRAMNTESKIKTDGTLVTIADIKISSFFKSNIIENYYKNCFFFCEEEANRKLKFPSCILDPIDGTKGFAMGRVDYAISFAYMHSSALNDPLNYAWVYAPESEFSVESGFNAPCRVADNSGGLLTGFVSLSDYESGLFSDLETEGVCLMPRGSIAFKLALLSVGACDFVFSKTDKNLWDIAAGTILLNERGFKCYDANGTLTLLDRERLSGPLLWCRERDLERLRYLLLSENKRK